MKRYIKITLMVSALILIVITAHSEEKSGFKKLLYYDQFNKGVLDTDWKWVDPRNDATLNFPRNNWIEIVATPGNDLQPKANLDAPRLIRSASGEFAIETKISPSHDGHSLSGGLIIWKDDDNFIRFDRGTWGSDTILLQKREGRLFQHIGDWFCRGNPIYLRMERRGSDLTALYSDDGKRWNKAVEFEFNLDDPLNVGLHTICFAHDFTPTASDFDYFKILSTGNDKPYRAKQQNKLSPDEIETLQKQEDKKLMERANFVLSKTASERNASAPQNVYTDPETGVNFTKILSDEKLDVISNHPGLTISPDGNFLFTPWEDKHWIVPLKEGEDPFHLTSQFADKGMLGSWSPDISKFAFVIASTGDLWVMPVSPKTGRPTGPPKMIFDEVDEHDKTLQYSHPSFSPDGEKLAFWSVKNGNSDIWIIPAEGGTPVQLTDDPCPERYPAWSPDGKSIAFIRIISPPQGKQWWGIWLIPAAGGTAEKLIEHASIPRWSPDGKYILYNINQWGPDSGRKINLFRLSDRRAFNVKGKAPKEVSWTLGWSKDSKEILYFGSGYDYQSCLKLVSAYGGPSVSFGKKSEHLNDTMNWSPDGKAIVTTLWGSDFGCWIFPIGGGAPAKIEIDLGQKLKDFLWHPLSPDMKKLVFIGEDLCLWGVPISIEKSKAIGPAVKITDEFKQIFGSLPSRYRTSWSPDSKKIAISYFKAVASPAGKMDDKVYIWVVSADGKKLIQLVEEPKDEQFPTFPAWSPDGKTLAYTKKGGIWLIPASGGKEREIVKEASSPSWSPDGNQLGFIGKSHVSVISLATGKVKNIVNLEANGLEWSWNLNWSPDGRNLAFLAYKSSHCRMWIVPVEGGEILELAQDDPGEKYSLIWSPDSKKLCYTSDRSIRVRTGAIWAADVEELLSKIE